MRFIFTSKTSHMASAKVCHIKTFVLLQRLGLLLAIAGTMLACQQQIAAQKSFEPDHAYIQYTGRVDFSNPKLPRFWEPGVYISFQFKGAACEVTFNDEGPGGKHNYLELVVDGKAERIQLKSKTETIKLNASGSGVHSAVICKNTETGIGYLELAGIRCSELVKPLPKPERKIECIGNSITSGSASDPSAVPCGKGAWYDQHNAWMSYGAVTARALNAQFHLSAVSGIGLTSSCCNMVAVMPMVFNRINLGSDTSKAIPWDFKKYQPDVVTICLGQNDGTKDSTAFRNEYVSFLKTLRGYYPGATFVLLSSPMANKQLRAYLRNNISEVEQLIKAQGENKVFSYVFEKQYIGGCSNHPSIQEHEEIAGLLTEYLKRVMGW